MKNTNHVMTLIVTLTAIVLAGCDTADDGGPGIKSISTINSSTYAAPTVVSNNAAGDAVMLWEEVSTASYDDPTKTNLFNTSREETAGYRCTTTLLKSKFAGAGGGWSSAVTLKTGFERKTERIARTTTADTTVDQISNPDRFVPQAFVDSNGNVIAVWLQSSKTDCVASDATPVTNVKTQLYSATYTKSTAAWSTAARLDSATGSVREFKLASDTTGNGYLVWTQVTEAAEASATDRTGASVVMGLFYNAASSAWGTSPTQLSTAGESANSPDVAVDNHGYAMAVWRQSDATDEYAIYATRYILNTGWSTSITQISTADKYSETPVIALDNANSTTTGGNATVAWAQYDSSAKTTLIYAARFTAQGASWSTPVALQSDVTSTAARNEATERAYDPSIAATGDGIVMVAWTQEQNVSVLTAKTNNSVVKHIYANVWIGNAWEPAQIVETSGRLDTDLARVAATSGGRLYVAWRTGGAFHGVYAREFTLTGGLGNILTLASPTAIVKTLDNRQTGNRVRVIWSTGLVTSAAEIQ